MTMTQLEKLPPHNLEAEQALISACLLDNQHFEYCDGLNPSEFYDLRHQLIFKTMLSLQAKRVPVDLVTLGNALKEKQSLDKAGGADYLCYIADAAPVAINCGHYADIVSDLAIKRKTIQFATQLYNNAYMSCAVSELIDFAQSESMKLQQSKRGDAILSMAEVVPAQIVEIERRNSTPKQRTLLLGFPRIDGILNIDGPKLIVIAGRPSMGKTAFAVTCMRNLSRLDVPCGFLSIEMGKEEIINRWLSMETGINSMKFYQYQGLGDDEIAKLEDAANEMQDWNIQIDDTGSVGIEDVERKCRKMVRNGAKVLFIDQLSKIRGKTGDQFKDYTVNCNRIADLKKELETPIFLLAQLNRELEKRGNKRPTLSDLKNTGALEEDADAVIFLFRPEYYEKKQEEKEKIKDLAEITIAKNRNGQTWVETGIKFDHKKTYFYQSDDIYGG